MPTPRVTPERWAKHDRLIDEGHSRESACRIVGISSVTSWRRDQRRGLNKTHQQVIRERKARTVPGQVRLKPQARKALDDFDYFRQRYLGRRPTPWQRMAVDQVMDWIDEAKRLDEKKYAVVNCPPGSGKSTLFTLDLLLWLIARDRSIRILIGSFTERQSKMYVDRLRRVLESTVPYSPSDDERRQGCIDAEATLAEDFGAFKPVDRAQSWNARELMVERAGLGGNIEKERTAAAFGMDGAFLGGRYDLVIWDDLVDEKNNANAETREKVRRWYDSTAESRVEPGGLFILQGQRLGPDDLYRYALDKVGFQEEDDEDDTPEAPKKYAHVLFRAHDEALCQKRHRPKHRPEVCGLCQQGLGCKQADRSDAVVAPWDGSTPGACLLDPHRLPWRDLAPIAANNPQAYLTVYQQEDTHSSAVLVPKVWIAGGLGEDGHHYPGCWDNDRRVGVVPKGLTGELVSFCAVDPSPTKWWACLAQGTSVATRRGEVPIEQVTTDDEVLTRVGWRPVLHRTLMGYKPTLNVTLSSGRVLRLTSDHRVLTAGGWVEAGSLTPGALLCSVPQDTGLRAGSTPAVAPVPAGSGFGPEVPVGADRAGGVGDDAWLAATVDLGRDVLQVLGVDATWDPAEVVQLIDDVLASPQAVRQTVRLARSRGLVDRPVPERVSRGGPEPTPSLVYPYPRGDVRLVVGDGASGVVGAVPARDTHAGLLGADGTAASASPHVVSVTSGSPSWVYDLGVADQHEFTAEGVIVHNCIWLAWHPDTNQMFVLDLHRRKMQAPDFLDWNHANGEFTGLAEDWTLRAQQQGAPIRWWIVEKNGAQRFMLQYEHMRRWQALREVSIVAHNTDSNKADPEFGVQTIASWFRHGQIRLPGFSFDDSRVKMKYLHEEVTKWPHSQTDDVVMALWFAKYQLPRLWSPLIADPPQFNRPSWLTGTRRLTVA